MDPELYRKVFVELDLDALQSQGMVDSFAQLRKMVGWMDEGIPGRTWYVVAAMMLKGEAGFHFMGDWAMVYFNNNGYKPQCRRDPCARAPMNVDQPGLHRERFWAVFFKVDDPDYQEGHKFLGYRSVADSQTVFNKAELFPPPRAWTSIWMASTPASSSHRPTCNTRSRRIIWSSAWRTTWRCRRSTGPRCSR